MLKFSRSGGNESETKELRRQVDSLVELLGHHGVRLETRSTNGPPRDLHGLQPHPPRYEAPDQVFEQNNIAPPPPATHVSMIQPPLSASNEVAVYVDPNQYLQNPSDGETWFQPPHDAPAENLVKQSMASPSNEPSYGTLVISSSGRSKYLGPSAASEWLKDVSQT